ncbi:MAG: IS200/IS605 family element transposase accessory protein TnpB [Symploca sp. SIO2D2]|nr:IS200/IS605 family element transposase accessory protein TnpB [Symploca sp. SIO2D2]
MLVLEYKAVVKKAQKIAISEAILTSQFVRNKVLRYWMDNPGIGKKELYRYNTQLRAEYSFVKELNSHACQASVENVERAIQRFFANCKSNKPGKKGYPKFKKHSRSVEYKQSGWKLHPTKRRINFLDLKGIGELKLLGKWDIHTFDVKLIKRVRIVRRADGYYVQFCVKVEHQSIAPISHAQVGIDVGLEYFYSDSNGHHEENPRFLRKAEQEIKRSQRNIYKKKKGSSGRRKACGIYARKHLKVTRQRNEHAKRLARNLCIAIAKVVLEDLNVSGLVRNHKLAKSIVDASWYNFRQWLEYFGHKFGRLIIAVPPHYTSIECSNCGARVQKSLSTRTHSCPHCGYIEQRDVNAAKVILSRATTEGHSGSNANGDVSSTSVGRKTCRGKKRR